MIPNQSVQNDLEHKLLEMISQVSLQHIPVDNIHMTDLLSDIGIDSLAFMEMVVSIEDEFKITIADEDLAAESFDTVETLMGYIVSKMSES